MVEHIALEDSQAVMGNHILASVAATCTYLEGDSLAVACKAVEAFPVAGTSSTTMEDIQAVHTSFNLMEDTQATVDNRWP